MPDIVFRRHDLVWLGTSLPLSSFALPPETRPLVEDWIARCRPFVVARQDSAVTGLRLGFTMPGTGPRQRIGLQVPPEAVVRHESAPRLADMFAYVPAWWREGITRLLHDFSGTTLVPRVFGSLVTEAFSGEPCLRPESDLDLLLACADRADVERTMTILRRHGQHAPHLDAELRLPHGDAVAWRELERALGDGDNAMQVLVKSDTEVRLMHADSFLGCHA